MKWLGWKTLSPGEVDYFSPGLLTNTIYSQHYTIFLLHLQPLFSDF